MRSRLAIAIAVVALGVPHAARAHVTAESAAPTGPDQVDIVLSSPAESAFLSATGGTVDRRPDDHYRLTVRPARSTVEIRVLSRDGHVTRIHLDERTAAAKVSTTWQRDPLVAILGRLLVLCALIAIVGSVAVARWIILPGNRCPLRPLGQADAVADERTVVQLTRAVRIIWTIAAAAGALGLVMGVAAVLHRLTSADLPGLLADTRTGHAMLVIAAALAFCGIVARRGAFHLERPTVMVGATASAIALVAISAAGHATAGRDALLGGVFDAAHLLATAIWIGGLIVLLAVWKTLRHNRGEDTAAVGRLGAIVVRFSGVAVACVSTLAVTGTYRALAELGSFGDLVHTPYGRALAVKLVLFALLLGIGSVNRFIVHPRLERAGIGLCDTDRGAVDLLGPTVRIELGLAAAVMVAVAVLIGFPPPG